MKCGPLIGIMLCFSGTAVAHAFPFLSAHSPCEQAISTAEHDVGLPPMLLATIARVESGRPDSATGRIIPWAWTLNVNTVAAVSAPPWPHRAVLSFVF
jgi:hypothetical protein